MTLKRLATLQWLGLFLGAAAWTAQHVVGFGLTQARCGAGGAHWNISNALWQSLLLAVAVTAILAAEAAAVGVLVRTRGESYESAPPAGRLRFFAIAAAAANVIFLVIVLLDGAASIYHTGCTQG